MSQQSCLSSEINNPEHFLREKKLIILLSAFLISGLFFMLFPGTLIGVLNLIQIAGKQSTDAAATQWIQAHGHAQLFGWIGTFILGIGFYSIPNLRRVCSKNFFEGWLCLALWAPAVLLRWYAVFTGIAWKTLLPLSAILEFSAVLYFVVLSFAGSRFRKSEKGMEAWSIMLIMGSIIWLVLMFINIFAVFEIQSLQAPIMPLEFNRKFLYASVWGFVLPVVLGLSARWLPALLGLQNKKDFFLILAAFASPLSVLLYASNLNPIAEAILPVSVLSYIYGLRLFERSNLLQEKKEKKALIAGFPVLVKTAYIWLFLSACLFLASAIFPAKLGCAGAARHAITVGFFSSMVFAIGPQMLPAFLGRTAVFNRKLVIISALILSSACLLRVCSEILAYDLGISAFWPLLSISAIAELLAMTIFAFNMVASLFEKPFVDQILDKLSKNQLQYQNRQSRQGN